jgi:hypothetical protein
MTAPEPTFATSIDTERERWYELTGLCRELTTDERMAPGYYEDPPWSVRDMVGHIGTWLAEGSVQLQRIEAGTYEGHDVDIDALNATFLAAMKDQPWDVVWVEAHAARTRMLQVWAEIQVHDDEADWWIRKSGGDHYGEHLERLREWVGELVARR